MSKCKATFHTKNKVKQHTLPSTVTRKQKKDPPALCIRHLSYNLKTPRMKKEKNHSTDNTEY